MNDRKDPIIELRIPAEAREFGLRMLSELLELSPKNKKNFYPEYKKYVRDLIDAIHILQVKKGANNKSERQKARDTIVGIFSKFYSRPNMVDERKTILNWKSRRRHDR